MREAIRELNRNFHTTIILTTHDMIDIEELCNHIIIIDNGKIIFDDMLQVLLKQGDLTDIVKKIFINGEMNSDENKSN